MMKKYLFVCAALGLMACGGAAEKKSDAPQSVGSSEIAYVLVDQVLAESDIYLKEGAELAERTEKSQKTWQQREQGLQYEATQLQNNYAKGLITTRDAEEKQAALERRARGHQSSMQKEMSGLEEENMVFGNRAQDLIRRAVKNVNADGRYRFIINASALIDADSTCNITAAVLAETNRLYAAEKK